MTKTVRLGWPILLLVLAGLACSRLQPEPSRPSPSGTIIYTSDVDGNADLYSLSVRGGTPTRLTNNSANDISPAWIASAGQIGFASDRQDRWNIFAMDVSGDNTVPVTSFKDIDLNYPDWSGDGASIAASLAEKCPDDTTTCNFDIYVMDADGGGLTNLTDTSASEWEPAWSPDGQKIAFNSDRDGDGEIFVMNRDGSELRQLTNNQCYDGRPRWSPDGTKLAYESDCEGGDWDIYTMNADGSNHRAVTNNTTHDYSQAWSPDGLWFVYLSNADGDGDLFIIGVDGQDQQRLTNNTYEEASPVWVK